MAKLRFACALAAMALTMQPAYAGSAESLSCIEQLFNDDQARAMADLGSDDAARSEAAKPKVDFLMLGMTSRMCARRNGWTENQYFNSIGYVLAWPTMRGLELQGADKGFAAIERAWSHHAAQWRDKSRLEDAEIDLLLTEARTDGLAVAAGEPAEKDARRYADVLQQVAIMRADFAANRKPASLRN